MHQVPAIDFDLRASWQARMLMRVHTRSGGAVILSMLSHYFDDAIPVLLRELFPGFQGIKPPFICSAAKVSKTGAVVADIVDRQERHLKDQVIFKNLDDFKDACRRLADRMKLTDQERLEFFTVAKAWVVADRRLDPMMDPQDPDARRLVAH